MIYYLFPVSFLEKFCALLATWSMAWGTGCSLNFYSINSWKFHLHDDWCSHLLIGFNSIKLLMRNFHTLLFYLVVFITRWNEKTEDFNLFLFNFDPFTSILINSYHITALFWFPGFYILLTGWLIKNGKYVLTFQYKSTPCNLFRICHKLRQFSDKWFLFWYVG